MPCSPPQDCVTHPGFNQFPQHETDRALFCLSGSGERQRKRLAIYSAMLEQMSDEHKLQARARPLFVDQLIQNLIAQFF